VKSHEIQRGITDRCVVSTVAQHHRQS
jgi:hypothetical protein